MQEPTEFKEEIKEESVVPNWLDEELKNTNIFDGEEKLPAIKFPENEIVEIDIDFSKKFNVYHDEENKSVKKIIPIVCKGEKMIWWLNTSNPTYREILEAGKKGQTHFKILRTGQMKKTRYSLVK